LTKLLIPKVKEQALRNPDDTPPDQTVDENLPPDDSAMDETLQEDTMVEKITVVAYDEDQRIARLLDYIKQLSDQGYSFRIVVDPEHEETMKAFHWEGEGIDEILSVDMEEIPISEVDVSGDEEDMNPPPPLPEE